ncbi:replication protein RepA [Azospirillum formosense]|uniref:replication protein RepA n=1 Tax=Azospirillum formosense TaxID=861533 RepID=UPI00338E74CE
MKFPSAAGQVAFRPNHLIEQQSGNSHSQRVSQETPIENINDVGKHLKSRKPIVERITNAGAEIRSSKPSSINFLHSVLCQVGLPRSCTKDDSFERTNGNVSLLLRAGSLWTGRGWEKQPLPYGAMPRLVLIHLCSEAVRTNSPVMQLGDSIRSFLLTIGVDTGGHEYKRFQAQMKALAACEMRLGIGQTTVQAQPIERFEAWLHETGKQGTLWPGTLELSLRFYDTLRQFAVPLDPRALGALRHSALALDTYTWLAHRLHRVRAAAGAKVSWANLRDQFGQEYSDKKNFKREMWKALIMAMAVYPEARVEPVEGGILLRQSPPPIAKEAFPVKTLWS